MNKLILIFFTSLLAITFACTSNRESKLIGTWKVENVETDFDESKVTPQMLKQVVEMQKETYFKILSDSTMVIISGTTNFDANWKLGDDNTLTYFFSGNETKPNKLGKVDDDKIIQVTNTPLGKITLTFKQE